jgi:hypothetical protein
MAETLEHTLSGQCGGKRWEATCAEQERFAVTAIRFEAVPGRWFNLGPLSVTFATLSEMRAAVEKRVRELQGG